MRACCGVDIVHVGACCDCAVLCSSCGLSLCHCAHVFSAVLMEQGTFGCGYVEGIPDYYGACRNPPDSSPLTPPASPVLHLAGNARGTDRQSQQPAKSDKPTKPAGSKKGLKSVKVAKMLNPLKRPPAESDMPLKKIVKVCDSR